MNAGNNYAQNDVEFFMATYSLKYIHDSLGRERAVQIPIKAWRDIEKKLKEREFMTKLRRNLDAAFEDVKLHQQGKKKLKTLDEWLKDD